MQQRRYFKTTLRVIFIAVTCMCIVVGYLANNVHQRTKTVAHLRAVGADLEYDRHTPSWRCPPYAPANESTERTWATVRAVWLNRVPFERIGDSLLTLRSLEFLDASDSSVNNKHVYAITSMRSLKCLDLSNNDLVTSECLRRLRRLKNLHLLKMSETGVTDAGLEFLPTSLRWVELRGCRISDAGMSKLANLPNLEGVVVSSENVTTRGLLDCTRNPRIRNVYLTGPLRRGFDVKAVQRARPSVFIHFDGAAVGG